MSPHFTAILRRGMTFVTSCLLPWRRSRSCVGSTLTGERGGRVVRWCWVNFQYRAGLLIWMIVGQGPIALAVGAGGGCLDICSLLYLFSPFSLSLGDGSI